MGQTGKVPGPIVMSFPGTDRKTDKQTERQTDRQGNSQMAKRLRPSLSSCARAPDPVLPWEPGGWGLVSRTHRCLSSHKAPFSSLPPVPSQQAGTFHIWSISRAEEWLVWGWGDRGLGDMGLVAALGGIGSGTRCLRWGTAQQGPYVQGRPPTLPTTPTWCNK